uniref:Uncharacterized protein n=1 Tax=Anguilla anguilla TaxID=7936 RepID=A0A0E9UTT3_ANGAN
MKCQTAQQDLTSTVRESLQPQSRGRPKETRLQPWCSVPVPGQTGPPCARYHPSVSMAQNSLVDTVL